MHRRTHKHLPPEHSSLMTQMCWGVSYHSMNSLTLSCLRLWDIRTFKGRQRTQTCTMSPLTQTYTMSPLTQTYTMSSLTLTYTMSPLAQTCTMSPLTQTHNVTPYTNTQCHPLHKHTMSRLTQTHIVTPYTNTLTHQEKIHEVSHSQSGRVLVSLVTGHITPPHLTNTSLWQGFLCYIS